MIHLECNTFFNIALSVIETFQFQTSFLSLQVTVPITSCQLMCKEVRSKCSPIMKSFSVDWPDSIDCEQLPRKEDENVLCMQPPTLAEHNNSAYERNGEKEHRKTYESANKEHGDSTPPTHIGDDVIARESKLEVDHKDETKFSNFGLEESTKYQPRVEVAPNLLENDINTYQGQPLDTHQGKTFRKSECLDHLAQ